MEVFLRIAAFVCCGALMVYSFPQLAPSLQQRDEWESWKVGAGKRYGSVEEELRRYGTWLDNRRYIERHNRDAARHGFTLRMNAFGDMNEQEWSKVHRCHNTANYLSIQSRAQRYRPSRSLGDLPAAMDWRIEDAVTGVKNQAEYLCHSCYAFAATGALEGMHALKTGQLISLSEQQILDCSRIYSNAGCRSGNYKYAWMYIIDNDGIESEESYPYRSMECTCQQNDSQVVATMNSMQLIEPGSEDDLQAAVAERGPVAVAIDHSHKSFQFYSEGVLAEPSCVSSFRNLSHEMVLVGYGQHQSGRDYWLLKNSYGTGWGMDGYVMMLRNMHNMCGIATDAAFPLL